MPTIFFPTALSGHSGAQFERYSMVRSRPLSVATMIFGIVAFLMFTAAHCALVRAVTPLPAAACYVVMLGGLMYGASRAKRIHVSGAFTVVYVVVLELGAFLNSADARTPFLWILPTAIIIPLCSAPFWLTRAHFVIGSLVSLAVTVPFLLHMPMTREEEIVTWLWLSVGFSSSITCFSLFYSYRVQHFVLETRLADLAATDPLTGVRNRRNFLEEAQRTIHRCETACEPVSALFIDIDHFKAINDQLGHAAGDRVIREVAAAIVEQTRLGDVVGRMGGEEFAVLLTTSPMATALEVAERLRRRIGTIRHPHGRVSVSLGLAEWDRGENLASLLDRADKAMLEAKRRGRDRVAASVRESASDVVT
ncbi:GGDEF domain-containing protein [Robbsia sp. Bb-Pol-6]|uniref:diguanylate cyclase n=1 Tax=Robbsia betulipollinis TaxID=2981849 RepID=A0ABT3ZNR4_9BURK|nr:GGDEF domain-containing protein [Robbsia betulipollinis]MCY0388184.1 GGDEF domain-containing protein [Robbsia betulipollinis]